MSESVFFMFDGSLSYSFRSWLTVDKVDHLEKNCLVCVTAYSSSALKPLLSLPIQSPNMHSHLEGFSQKFHLIRMWDLLFKQECKLAITIVSPFNAVILCRLEHEIISLYVSKLIVKTNLFIGKARRARENKKIRRVAGETSLSSSAVYLPSCRFPYSTSEDWSEPFAISLSTSEDISDDSVWRKDCLTLIRMNSSKLRRQLHQTCHRFHFFFSFSMLQMRMNDTELFLRSEKSFDSMRNLIQESSTSIWRVRWSTWDNIYIKVCTYTFRSDNNSCFFIRTCTEIYHPATFSRPPELPFKNVISMQSMWSSVKNSMFVFPPIAPESQLHVISNLWKLMAKFSVRHSSPLARCARGICCW